MSFPKVRSPELASCFNREADLHGSWWFETGYSKGRYQQHYRKRATPQ